jgi:PAS domain S-box-containing protein
MTTSSTTNLPGGGTLPDGRSPEAASSTPMTWVTPETPLEQVVVMFDREHLTGLMVVDQQQLVGLVTVRDILRCIAQQTPLDAPIGQHMTQDLAVLQAQDLNHAFGAIHTMRQRGIHHLPVVNANHEPVDLITVNDLQQHLVPPHVLKLQTVRSLVTPRLGLVSQTDTMAMVAHQLVELQLSCVLVLDEEGSRWSGRPIGMVLRQDVIRMVAQGLNLDQVTVRSVMRDALFFLKPSDSLWLAYQEMQQHQLSCLVVLESDETLLGLITQSDLIYSLDLHHLQHAMGATWQLMSQAEANQANFLKHHQAELERLVQARTEQLAEQAKCDRILTTLTQHIHESLDLQAVLSTTVSEVRQLLQTDRASIFQFDTAASGTIVVEAAAEGCSSILGQAVRDDCFADHWSEAYRKGRIQAIEDIHQARLHPCHVDLLARLHIRANLVIPIVYGQDLWGLLMVNQCDAPRRWRNWEIRLLQQLTHSLAIAIRQSELYQKLQAELAERERYEAHLQQLNDDLEEKVEARTASWRQVTAQLREEITQREQAQAALQTSETKFRSLVEQTNDWVWEIDANARFVYVSPRATEIIGYCCDDMVGQRFSDFMPADEAIRFKTVLNLSMQQHQPFTQIEANCIHKLGQSVVLEMSGAPIFTAEGQLQGYRGITRDITERKQIEVDIRKALTKEKELSELKTRFISMASHEFRTPLTTILASTETLERYRHKLPEAKQQAVINRIKSSIHHIIGMLNDVLTIGKAEAGKLDCQPQPIHLKQFCNDVIEELQLAQKPPITPIEFIKIGAHYNYLADEKLLRHIFTNLLSNALKYSPEHQPVVFTLDTTGDEVIFRVQDQGIGISEEDQQQLFETFHRGRNVGNISGTGLGLVIAKRATIAHRGSISCTSQLGQGTTFTVTLPLPSWSEDHG